MDFTSRHIIVTGAGSGIGQATARLLNEMAAHLSLIDISEEGLKATIGLLANPDNARIHVADLSRSEDVQQAVEGAVAYWGAVDGVAHCAGISSRKPLRMLRREGFARVMDVNFYSYVEMLRLLSKGANMNDGASLVAMSSISSTHGYKAKSEYCVSKAALDAFTRCMALELAPRRIRVNTVMAAEVNTPLAAKARDMQAALGVTPQEAPLGVTQPDEVAHAIAFLLSPITATITGTALLIDGGASLL